MDPICFQEIGEEHNGTEGPGDGIGPGDGGQFRHEPHGDGDIADADHTPTGKHGEHGHGGFACTSHNAGDAVGKGQQAIE